MRGFTLLPVAYLLWKFVICKPVKRKMFYFISELLGRSNYWPISWSERISVTICLNKSTPGSHILYYNKIEEPFRVLQLPQFSVGLQNGHHFTISLFVWSAVRRFIKWLILWFVYKMWILCPFYIYFILDVTINVVKKL